MPSLVLLAVGILGGDASFAVLPDEIALQGLRDRQHVLVQRADGDKLRAPIGNAEIVSGDQDVCTVTDGLVTPVGDGTTELRITVGGRTQTVPVTVSGTAEAQGWSFRNHVQAVLAKSGCNSGACHGAAAGKKGFRLSLRGYDAAGDFDVLTKQARGRRIDRTRPGRSLMLLKPTTAVRHGGGRRFDVDSREYRVIADWVAAGAEPPTDDDARITGIRILPEHVILRPGDEQPFVVQASFDDGRTEDVTEWVKYTATNGDVAAVDEGGAATVRGFGEGSVTAWYLNQLAIAQVTVPYDNDVTPDAYAELAAGNFIDREVADKLRDLNLPPSPACGDAEFVRRAHLDTTGVLPTVAETEEYTADADPHKREKLVDRLLAGPEFIDYWTYRFSDLLLVSTQRLPEPAMWSYSNWVRGHIEANTPWDEMVRDLVTAQGSTLSNGAANFYVLHQDPKLVTENLSLAFLGMSINCARCHNHPLEKWTNEQYFAMANLVGRVRRKTLDGEGATLVYDDVAGDVVQPLTGHALPPQPLEGAVHDAARGSRREHLAEWLTGPANPYFTRAIVNRVWKNYFGVALVEQVDDLRLTNPASNERLLSAAADHLIDQDYDLRQLMRSILLSETYRRSSTPLPGNAGDTRFYSRYYPRRMIAEVMMDAVSQVTGVPTTFPGYPAGWRALQLPDTQLANSFLSRFGRPEREVTCACERTNEPNVPQILHIANGDTVNAKLAAADNRIATWLESQASIDAILDELYLAALSRRPSIDEREQLAGLWHDTAEPDRRAFLEDTVWAVLSSKEFLFNR